MSRKTLCSLTVMAIAILGAAVGRSVADAPAAQAGAQAAETAVAARISLTAGIVTTTGSAPAVATSWTNPAGNATATGYTLQRATDANFTAGLTSFTTSNTSYIDSSGVANTTYYYRVCANAAAANSQWSNTVAISTPAGQAPASPTGLTVGAATATTVPLTWTNGVGGGAMQGVIIMWASDAGFTTGVASATVMTPGLTSYTVAGLTAHTSYYFKVADLNSGGVSAWSNVASAATP